MDKEVEEYYENMREMFQTEGWKQLMAEAREEANTVNNVLFLRDANQMYEAQGKLSVLYKLIGMEDTVDNILNGIEDDPSI